MSGRLLLTSTLKTMSTGARAEVAVLSCFFPSAVLQAAPLPSPAHRAGQGGGLRWRNAAAAPKARRGASRRRRRSSATSRKTGRAATQPAGKAAALLRAPLCASGNFVPKARKTTHCAKGACVQPLCEVVSISDGDRSALFSYVTAAHAPSDAAIGQKTRCARPSC